jgi:hypothetical protein
MFERLSALSKTHQSNYFKVYALSFESFLNQLVLSSESEPNQNYQNRTVSERILD